MTDECLSKTEMEWMLHGINLCRDRLRALREDADPELRLRLQYENHVCLCGWDHRRTPELLGGAARVWFVYMVAHARLEIERYARAISEDEFQARCAELRAERDKQDRRCAGLKWLLDDGADALPNE